jgi:hypothetical protein
MQRRNARAAVAAAEVPVPDEVVGPTPRSKMRISISCSLTTRTNSTLVLLGKIAMRVDLRAESHPSALTDGEVRLFDEDDEVRIAGGDFDADDLNTVNQLERVRHKPGHAHSGGDFDGEVVAIADGVDAADAETGIGVISSLSPGFEPSASAIHAATQRVPLPLISAMEPSALCRRMRPECGPGPDSFFQAKTQCRLRQCRCCAGRGGARVPRDRGLPQLLQSR